MTITPRGRPPARNGHYASAMPITPPEDEPIAGPWRVAPLSELVSVLLKPGGRLVGRPRIVAVDGRSGSGKTTLPCGRATAALARLTRQRTPRW
jgi:hypothetical protein